MVIPCIDVRTDGLDVTIQASIWGSLLPAVWSFMLAARERGLGTCWTTLHLVHEQEAAELLGIPDNIMQGALIPVAHTIGTDFKAGAAPRHDADRPPRHLVSVVGARARTPTRSTRSRTQQAELIALVEGRGEDELLAPSRCDGWTVADVLLHLAQTNEMAVASVEGRLARVRRRGGGVDPCRLATSTPGRARWSTPSGATRRRRATATSPAPRRRSTAFRAVDPGGAGAVGGRRHGGAHARHDPPDRDLDPHGRRRRGVRPRTGPDRPALAHLPPDVAHGARTRWLAPASRHTATWRSSSTAPDGVDLGVRRPRRRRRPSCAAPRSTCAPWPASAATRPAPRWSPTGPDADDVLRLVRTFA